MWSVLKSKLLLQATTTREDLIKSGQQIMILLLFVSIWWPGWSTTEVTWWPHRLLTLFYYVLLCTCISIFLIVFCSKIIQLFFLWKTATVAINMTGCLCILPPKKASGYFEKFHTFYFSHLDKMSTQKWDVALTKSFKSLFMSTKIEN